MAGSFYGGSAGMYVKAFTVVENNHIKEIGNKDDRDQTVRVIS